MYLRVLLAIIVIGAVGCLALGAFIGLIWAISHPERAPHGGLLLGLPGGFLFLEGLLLSLGGLWIFKRWKGFALGGPLIGAILPLAATVDNNVIWIGGFIGLVPFAGLAWVIRSLS
jgi:hypothetical protein